MVLVYAHDCFLMHDTGDGHPECSDRLRAIYRRLKQDNFAYLQWREPSEILIEKLYFVHTRAYVERVLDMVPDTASVMLDNDTVLGPKSGRAALVAAGAVVDAVDAIMDGKSKRAFCAVRPPGHHAEADHAMGFCIFNNIAIGAMHALNRHGVERVAIIDFDVHHGNGTQHSLQSDPRVFFASMHQSPLYPGTGSMFERGDHNNVLNIPLRPSSRGDDLRTVVTTMLVPSLAAFQPQLVMVSAGFDAHTDDPLANLQFCCDDYGWLTTELITIADNYANGRLVSVLEGGYNLTALADSAAAHVAALSTNI